MTMLNCFCGAVDRQKVLSLIRSLVHYQRVSSLQISNTPQAGFKSQENLSSCFVEGNCDIVLTIVHNFLFLFKRLI